MALGTSKDQSRERNTKVRYVIEPKEKVTQQFDDGNRYKSIRFKQSIVAMQFNQSALASRSIVISTNLHILN